MSKGSLYVEADHNTAFLILQCLQIIKAFKSAMSGIFPYLAGHICILGRYLQYFLGNSAHT